MNFLTLLRKKRVVHSLQTIKMIMGVVTFTRCKIFKFRDQEIPI
jgi:hypothetical protein